MEKTTRCPNGDEEAVCQVGGCTQENYRGPVNSQDRQYARSLPWAAPLSKQLLFTAVRSSVCLQILWPGRQVVDSQSPPDTYQIFFNISYHQLFLASDVVKEHSCICLDINVHLTNAHRTPFGLDTLNHRFPSSDSSHCFSFPPLPPPSLYLMPVISGVFCVRDGNNTSLCVCLLPVIKQSLCD